MDQRVDVDDLRLAAIKRCKHVWQVRARLHFPDAKARLQRIAIVEERIRARAPPPVKPRRVIREASPIDEAESSATKRPTRGVELGGGSDSKGRRPKPTPPC